MTHESTADNCHFVAELLQGRSIEDRRDVDLSFFVWNISEIDVINQKFLVRFNMYASWNEDVTNLNVDDVPAKSFTAESFKWNPQLRFTNCIEQNSDEYESWFRVLSLKDSSLIKSSDIAEHVRVRVMYCQRIQGWFSEGFEMQNFPFDIQHLHIGVTTSWDHEKVALSFDMMKPTRVSSTALTSQTWDLYSPRLLSYSSDWDKKSMPFLSQSSDSATSARYCKAYLALTAARRPNFTMWNVMVIMTLVGFMSFATYALDPADLGDRQACVLTLVLTTVAFKYVTTSMMPEISYVTMMDVVIYSCMFLQAAMMLCICISANIDDPDRTFDFLSVGALSAVWIMVLVWFTIKSILLDKKRNLYISDCDRKFYAMQNSETSIGKFYAAVVMPQNYQ